MNIPDVKSLLKEFDTLSYSERIRRISVIGSKGKGTDDLNTLLNTLKKGDIYEQSLALYGAIASRNRDIFLPYISSSSTLLRNIAAGYFFRVIKDDETCLNIIKTLPLKNRKKILKNINKTELAEKIFSMYSSEYTRSELINILPLCKQETVEKYLHTYGHSVTNWTKPTIYHKDTVIKYIKDTFSSSPPREYISIWNKFEKAVKILLRTKTKEIMDLLFTFCDGNNIPDIIEENLAILLTKEPSAVFELLTGPSFRGRLLSYGLPPQVLRHIRRFKKEEIIEIGKIFRKKPEFLAPVLEYTAPSQRKEIFEKIYEGTDIQNYEWPYELLEVLPHDIRNREALRMAGMKKIKENPEKLFKIQSYCNIEEIRSLLEEGAKVPKAEERIKALKLLIECTGRYRKGVRETLSFLERIKNEQDPVRLQVFNSLAFISSLFRDEHIQSLEKIINDACAGKDTSHSTFCSAGNIILSILKYQNGKDLTDFALKMLKELFIHSSQPILPYCCSNLPKGMEKKIINSLAPVIKEENNKEHFNSVISLADFLGKKGWEIKELQNMVEPAIKSKDRYIAYRGVELWLKSHKTRDERVEKLLKKDRSFITNNKIFNHIHLKRQDLLAPFLTGKPIKGAYLTGKTVYLLPASDGFHRWLPEQQKAFRELLEKITKDTERNISERCQGIKIISAITSTDLKDMMVYLKDKEQNIFQSALMSISRLDRKEELPEIAGEFLYGDSGRVAIDTIRNTIAFLEPDKIKNFLINLLSKENLKITVYKEIFRIIGNYNLDPHCTLLFNEWKKPDIHRDIRIAIISVAQMQIHKEKAMEILKEASMSEDPEIARSLLNQKSDILSFSEKETYLNLLIELTKNSNLKVRKETFAILDNWSGGFEDKVGKILSEKILNIQDSPEWPDAVKALTDICSDGRGTDIVKDTLKGLLNIKTNIEPEKERDLPQIQRLFQLISSLSSIPYIKRMKIRSFLKELGELILPDFWSEGAKLILSSINWSKSKEILKTIAEINEKITDKFFINYLTGHIEHILKDYTISPSPQILLEVIDKIIDSSETNQHTGLAILNHGGNMAKWSPKWTERLVKFRQSPYYSVKYEALKIWVHKE